MTSELHSKIFEVGSVSQALKYDMFAIYARYYEPAIRSVFLSDLNAKSHVITLHDSIGELRGFSTLITWKLNHEGRCVHIIYSGDTIIEQEFWGSQTLPFNWIEFAGSIKAQSPDIPLYWFLITKGHRTYRYMALFSKVFYPCPDRIIPTEIQNLMHKIGTETFADQYCKNTGVVVHQADSAALKPGFHGARVANNSNKEIDFFIAKNPGYESGDELLCLCELSAENLRPMARKQFERGMRDDVMAETA